MIVRAVEQHIESKLFKGKAILLFGPRQVGKSTVLETVIQRQDQPWLYLNGDDADVRAEAGADRHALRAAADPAGAVADTQSADQRAGAFRAQTR